MEVPKTELSISSRVINSDERFFALDASLAITDSSVNRLTSIHGETGFEYVAINSIIAVKRSTPSKYNGRAIPPLTNRELFTRDANLCMYCGNKNYSASLTRDHVVPLSKGVLFNLAIIFARAVHGLIYDP